MKQNEKRQEYSKLKALPPTCPFCGLPVERPQEQINRRPREMPVGTCSCGAVYACDSSGHNLGAAFIEALVCSCNDDWDLAWGLLPEDDYLEQMVANYDYETHRIVPGGSYQGRRITGALYFVKLQPDILEFTGPGLRQKMARRRTTPARGQAEDKSAATGFNSEPAAPASCVLPTSGTLPPNSAAWINAMAAGRRQQQDENGSAGAHAAAPMAPARKRLSKQQIRDIVAAYDYQPLLECARSDHRLVRELQRLLCSGDELLRLRAADVLGKAAAVIASDDPGLIARLLQGLLTSVTDPGAAAWGAVDAAGEIIAAAPATFAGYIPTLYELLAHETLRPHALRALARIGAVRPDLLQRYSLRFLPYLQDSNATTRGYAACLLGRLQAASARKALQGLMDDHHPVTMYHNGTLEQKTVGELAAAALAQLETVPRLLAPE